MPYISRSDLPPPARETLPMEALRIYLTAFHDAWDERSGAGRREAAHRAAWSAVKNAYEKRNGGWVKKR